MTNLCTKVAVRKRPLKNGQTSLYLDFYPAIRHPKTGKPTRREFLGIYIYTHPTESFQVEFNNTTRLEYITYCITVLYSLLYNDVIPNVSHK